MKLVAAIPIMDDALGFAIPVFANDGEYFVQATDKDWTIKEFQSISKVPEIAFDVPASMDVDLGSESVHVFRLPHGGIVYGKRPVFAARIGAKMDQIEGLPVEEEIESFFELQSSMARRKKSIHQHEAGNDNSIRLFLADCTMGYILNEL